MALAICEAPAILAEAKAMLPALRRVATAKAGREGVKAVIGKRFALYPQPQRSEGEWAAWWEAYYDVLADVSLASLEAAMRAYVAAPDSEFMPKPGRLRELAFTAPCRSLQRLYRAELAVRQAEAPKARLGPPADATEIRQVLDAFRSRTPTTRPNLPSIAGKPDETGITPQLRELVERQRRGRP